jgi:hypothetical protein
MRAKRIALSTLKRIAASLLSEDGENPEYDRALSELVTDAAGLSMEFASATLVELRNLRETAERHGQQANPLPDPAVVYALLDNIQDEG